MKAAVLSRIILEKTEMGRDLLAQDYLLKQITSSLMYPESGLGKSFWDKVYARAYEKFGNTNIPVNTINKVWITPDEAVVYESNNTALILKSRLKVMLEEDYLAMNKNGAKVDARNSTNKTDKTTQEIIRQIILPELEREVNEGKNFAQLRQIFSAMVLATWYKKALKESLLGKVYTDQSKVKGVDQADTKANAVIYQQYLEAFKKGVYSYIKEDEDKYTKQIIPRKYFAGGVDRAQSSVKVITTIGPYSEEAAAVTTQIAERPLIGVSALFEPNPAMGSVAYVVDSNAYIDLLSKGDLNKINLERIAKGLEPLKRGAYSSENIVINNQNMFAGIQVKRNQNGLPVTLAESVNDSDFYFTTIPGVLPDGRETEVIKVTSEPAKELTFSLDALAVEKGTDRIKYLYTTGLEGFIHAETGEFLRRSNLVVEMAKTNKALIPVIVSNDGKELKISRVPTQNLSIKERLTADAVIEKFNDVFSKEAQYRQENAGAVNVVRNFAKKIILRAISLFRLSNTENNDYLQEMENLKRAAPSGVDAIIEKTQEIMANSSAPQQGILNQQSKAVYYGNDLNSLAKAVYGNDRSDTILEVIRLIENGYFVPVEAISNGQGLMLNLSSEAISGIDMGKVNLGDAEAQLLVNEVNNAFMKRNLDKLKQDALNAKTQQQKSDEEIKFYKDLYAAQIKASISGARGLGETAADVRVNVSRIAPQKKPAVVQVALKPQTTPSFETPFTISDVSGFAKAIGPIIDARMEKSLLGQVIKINGSIDSKTGVISLGESNASSAIPFAIQRSPLRTQIRLLVPENASKAINDFVTDSNSKLEALEVGKAKAIPLYAIKDGKDILLTKSTGIMSIFIKRQEYRVVGNKVLTWDNGKKEFVDAINPQTIWNKDDTVTFEIYVEEKTDPQGKKVEVVRIHTTSGVIGDVTKSRYVPSEVSEGAKEILAKFKEMDNVGGIDLNSANMIFNIKRDGKGVALPFTQQDLRLLNNIQGFIPTIFEIKPVMNLPIVAELEEKLKNASKLASVS
jgi:hypothetical protein